MFADTLIEKLQHSQHLVILTGAGVSAESGIATFRDALTGLWKKYEAETLATEQGFRADPALVWGWYEWRRKQVLQAKPNPAHYAIAQITEQLPKVTLMTQNVDDLHERAGSQNVLHLHGSLHQPRCLDCDQAYDLPEQAVSKAKVNVESRIEPPHCNNCDGSIRPGVVWFGEQLPVNTWKLAQEACRQCDLMLVIGTSGVVWPVADLPNFVNKDRGCVVQINPNITSLNGLASYNLSGKAGEILPRLHATAFNN